MSNFFEIGLSSVLTQAISEMGFEETTPIQERTIPLVLEGKDIIGQAQTGTGKTAAFGIPMIERMKPDRESIKALVVTPTRELAIQVAEELNRIGQFKGVRSLPIYGGQDIDRQIRSLRNRPQIIVGTPGRLMDHMRRRTIRLQQVETVVLDEADEMLSMGFVEDIENILKEVPEQRQTLLFSATMPKSILDLAQRFMQNPEYISMKTKEIIVPQIEQCYVEVQEKQKFDVLCRLLDIQSPDLAIVFGRTKRRVDELFEALSKRGYSAEGIHGDLTQARRDMVMRHFKEGLTEILVATDVAARGLDISGVTHVYNFDVPQDPESYVHRIGRTGRAGKGGQAITFVTPREIGHLRLIEQVAKRRITRKPLPTFNDVLVGQQRLTMDKILKAAEDEDILRYKEMAEELLEDNDSITLLSAALKLLTKEPSTAPIVLTEEAPLRSRQPRRFDQQQGFHRNRDNSKYPSRFPKRKF
ncbi:Cold-shock DEAD-box protein A [Dehalobacter sp. UNSWDHB]|jgi:Superfamily II DNA and RNA helicases|uniref:DEAD/DEAH box helicase n=1 Tax=unclassified Dehalobacter TaxID=2635733 RepID=UPI00028AA84E|nr:MULTISPECIES: DEAD/DEAH box helicase [unclassified Dehalobacter]AFV03771.1 Cold-shock DEAD-box protein A [Dehalobacter sp. DCA]AFV06757.1 Cold-shock DEAD-box protein A [Dehalobacter sp. CF]EQB20453.1 Cold-shock DEAD-box protein A [Dehalobacter sp. UNSWDHB]